MQFHGMVNRFCDFWYGDSGNCEQCDQVTTEDDCNGLQNDKGITECKRVCFSKSHLEKLDDI